MVDVVQSEKRTLCRDLNSAIGDDWDDSDFHFARQGFRPYDSDNKSERRCGGSNNRTVFNSESHGEFFIDSPTRNSTFSLRSGCVGTDRGYAMKQSSWWQQNNPATAITTTATVGNRYEALKKDAENCASGCYFPGGALLHRATRQQSVSLVSLSPSFSEWDPDEAAMEDFRGRVVAMAKVQFGSRFLQRQLFKGNPVLLQLIVSEVENDMDTLMVDPYGNYFCQQLFKTCHLNQPESLVTKIAMNATKISSDRRGTHAMQTLISLLKTAREEMIIVTHIKAHVLEMSLNRHATHVLQRVLGCFSFASVVEILRPLILELSQLAHHPHGICVVKRCLSAVSISIEGSSESDCALESTRLDLCESVHNALSFHVKNLIQSPYGNYALQHALDVWGEAPCQGLMAQIKSNLIALSTQKFSSNVVEKCLQYASEQDMSDIISDFSDPQKMAVLVNSPFGNFVVQKAVDRTTPTQSLALYNAITASASQLQNRRLQLKWERILQKIRQRLPKKAKPPSPVGSPRDFGQTTNSSDTCNNGVPNMSTSSTPGLATSCSSSPWLTIGPPIKPGEAASLSDPILWQDEFTWSPRPVVAPPSIMGSLDAVSYPSVFTTLGQLHRGTSPSKSISDVRIGTLRMCQGVYPYEPLSGCALLREGKLDDPFLCL